MKIRSFAGLALAVSLCLALWVALPGHLAAQNKEPWTGAQLMQPSELATALQGRAVARPVVIDVGPAGQIKGALVAGPAHEADGMETLRKLLDSIPRDREVVIYCGCCPFAKCPNVRPAFKTLLNMGFKRPRLLNLSHNLKADWIDKGYPLADQ